MALVSHGSQGRAGPYSYARMRSSGPYPIKFLLWSALLPISETYFNLILFYRSSDFFANAFEAFWVFGATVLCGACRPSSTGVIVTVTWLDTPRETEPLLTSGPLYSAGNPKVAG